MNVLRGTLRKIVQQHRKIDLLVTLEITPYRARDFEEMMDSAG